MSRYGYKAPKVNIQQDSSDDDTMINTSNPKVAVKPNNRGKHHSIQFEVVVLNRIVCTTSELFLHRLLSFDAHPREAKNPLPKYRKTKAESNSSPTLYDCFEQFRQTEKLEKDNSWYCNKCKDHVEATKKIEVYRIPSVLILCLQRFKSHGNYFKEKLEDNILFPLEGLDLGPQVLSNRDGQSNEVELLYDCIAVSNHYGSLAFGHYTAYAKNFESGKWYDFNDSSVSALSRDPENEVVSNAAYVIYYVRRDFFPTKVVNFSQVKIQSLTSLPEEMAPLVTISAQIVAKHGPILS